MFENDHSYDDIIYLPHHVSEKRTAMSLHDRAAQFSPFAALTGYDDAVEETARLTDEMAELTEDVKAVLDERLRILSANGGERPEISVRYFVPDERKKGGAYVWHKGILRRVDEYERNLVFADGSCIPLGNICSIEGDVFEHS